MRHNEFNKTRTGELNGTGIPDRTYAEMIAMDKDEWQREFINVTDVGIDGSFWYCDGTSWILKSQPRFSSIASIPITVSQMGVCDFTVNGMSYYCDGVSFYKDDAKLTIPLYGYSELNGDSTYSQKGLGFLYPASANITVNRADFPIWCSSATDIQWRAWVRSNLTGFDTTVVPAMDSGVIKAADFPTASAVYSLFFNQNIDLQAGQYLIVLFRSVTNSNVTVRKWNWDASKPSRNAFPLFTSSGWGTWGVSSYDAGNNFGQVDPIIYTVNKKALAIPDVPRITLPDKIQAVVGDTLQVFAQGCIEALNTYRHFITFDCDIGNSYPRYFETTPVVGNVGNHTLTVNVHDINGSVIATKSTTINVFQTTHQPASAKQVLCMGDSLTAAAVWSPEFYRRVTGTGGTPAGNAYGNTTFIGNRGTGGKYVGYGGWSVSNYLGIANTASSVTAAAHGKDSTDIGATYTDANSVTWILDKVVDANTLKMVVSGGGAATMPASGTLTYVAGAAHTGNITFSAQTAGYASPMWNGSSATFTQLVSNCGASSIDIAYILLGWNSVMLTNPTFTVDDYSAYLAQYRTLLNQLHTDYPSAVVRIVGIQVPSLNGGLGANYGATGGYSQLYKMLKTAQTLNLAYQSLANEAAYSSWVKFVSVAPVFDSENNMPITTKAVNTRNATTENIGTNGVHPASSGYYQIADAAYRDFVSTYC